MTAREFKNNRMLAGKRCNNDGTHESTRDGTQNQWQCIIAGKRCTLITRMKARVTAHMTIDSYACRAALYRL